MSAPLKVPQVNTPEYQAVFDFSRGLIDWLRGELVAIDKNADMTAPQRAYASGKNDTLNAVIKRLEGR